MLLFVQNQASFSDPVTLTFDPLVFPAMQSAPIPRYALLLICFTFGALLVLLMLLWDRLSLGSRSTCAFHRANSLEKKLEKAQAEIERLNAEVKKLEEEKAALQTKASDGDKE